MPQPSEENRTSEPTRQFVRFASWILFAVMAVPAAVTLANGFKLLDLPYETSRPESFIVHGIKQIAVGNSLYPEVGEEPYAYHVYNPMTYYPAGLAGRLFGLSTRRAAFVGRSIAYVCFVATGILLGYWMWYRYRSPALACLAAVCPIYFQSVVATDFFRVRPESPAIMFTIAGVLIMQTDISRRGIWAAGLFFVSFLFKQSFVAAPVGVCLYLIFSGKWREWFSFTTAYASLIVFFLIAMWCLTGKGYFQHTIDSMVSNEVNPVAMWRIIGPQLWNGFWGPILALLIALIVAGLVPRLRLQVCVLCASAAWTYYSAGKIGSSLNYVGESCVLSLAMVFSALGTLWRSKRASRSLALLLILPLAAHFVSDTRTHGIADRQLEVFPEDISEYVEKYRNLGGRLLITHESVAIHSDHVVGFDWVLLGLLQSEGKFSCEPILQEIRAGGFDRVVISSRPLSLVEWEIMTTTTDGPYEIVYRDNTIVELARRNP